MALRKSSIFYSVLLAVLVTATSEGRASFFNWGSCLRWRITGICRIVCHNYGCNVWVRVRHWRPDEVSETVNIPGDSIWAESFPGIRRFDLRRRQFSDSLRSFQSAAVVSEPRPVRS